MTIEDSIEINADIQRVWNTFTNIACWGNWCSAVHNVAAEEAQICTGSRLSFCIRPFSLPINIAPQVSEVDKLRKVVWTGRKFGITATHEFSFSEHNGHTVLTSTEVFTGFVVRLLPFLIPSGRLHKITINLLEDIKRESERPAV